MKRILTLAIVLILSAKGHSQVSNNAAPNRMSYQSVVRNSTGQLVVSTNVGVRISILQGSASGTPVYIETHTVMANANGLVSLEIGGGAIMTGSFSLIDWSAGPYFIKTETDPAGGTSYSVQGTSQLLSVPYALYAAKAGNSYWTPDINGIYYNGSRVAIGTVPNPIVPLTIYDNNPNGNGNAVLHIKSNDTYHTSLTMFNGSVSDSRYYSLLVTGPANNTAVPGTFGLFNHAFTGYSFNFNRNTNNMAIGSMGFNAKDPKSKLHIFNGDVNIDQIGSGIIMKSPDGSCWRVTIGNTGNFVSTAITCPQ